MKFYFIISKIIFAIELAVAKIGGPLYRYIRMQMAKKQTSFCDDINDSMRIFIFVLVAARDNDDECIVDKIKGSKTEM